MIGFIFGAINFLVALPGYALIALTLYGMATTPNGESRAVNVLKCLARVCSATLEAAWAAQRMLPAKKPKSQPAGFLALPAAFGLFSALKGMPWLRIGLAAAACVGLLFLINAYGDARQAQGEAKIRDEWEPAVKATLKKAADAQASVNSSSASIDADRVKKVDASKVILAQGRKAVEESADEATAYRRSVELVRRLREQGNLPTADLSPA